MGERIRGRKGVALRKRRLAAEPLCRMCKAEGRVTAATVPDHIVPLAKGGEAVAANTRSLCAAHHAQVTREALERKSVVTGKRVSVRLDAVGRRSIKKNTTSPKHSGSNNQS